MQYRNGTVASVGIRFGQNFDWSIDTPTMWLLFVDSLFVSCENEIVRPKIRQKIHQVCHRALMNEKLSDEQLNDWVKRSIFILWRNL